MENGFLVVEGVSKSLNDEMILSNVSFELGSGELFSLLGPSGSGKSTLLRILAGLETPDEGVIFLDGGDLLSLPIQQRPIHTVFQNYALFPHMTVYENIAFGLFLEGNSSEHIRKRVSRMMEMVRLTGNENKSPSELSGGQKQRVALARSLVKKPKLLLLDEPLSALDLKLRQKMLVDLQQIQSSTGITFIMVTHDQTEAISISDRIAVLYNGAIESMGTPQDLYDNPKTLFAASFVGDANLFRGTLTERQIANQKRIVFIPSDEEADIKIAMQGEWFLVNETIGNMQADVPMMFGIRPEKLKAQSHKPTADTTNYLKGIIAGVTYRGIHTRLYVQIGDKVGWDILMSQSSIGADDLDVGQMVYVCWESTEGFLVPVEAVNI